MDIWKVKENLKGENDKELVSKESYGQFYSAESYVMLLKYTIKLREEFLIYFWYPITRQRSP